LAGQNFFFHQSIIHGNRGVLSGLSIDNSKKNFGRAFRGSGANSLVCMEVETLTYQLKKGH